MGTQGVEVNASSPVTLVAKDNNGNSKSYTLKVVKAKVASGADMIKKASTFTNFPSGLIDYDMTFFNGKFYAITTSLSGSGEVKTENYQLFSSEDGLNWTEVDYKTDATGLTLPEGQTNYVIGGEGARLAVFNGRMYILGGARTKGMISMAMRLKLTGVCLLSTTGEVFQQLTVRLSSAIHWA